MRKIILLAIILLNVACGKGEFPHMGIADIKLSMESKGYTYLNHKEGDDTTYMYFYSKKEDSWRYVFIDHHLTGDIAKSMETGPVNLLSSNREVLYKAYDLGLITTNWKKYENK